MPGPNERPVRAICRRAKAAGALRRVPTKERCDLPREGLLLPHSGGPGRHGGRQQCSYSVEKLTALSPGSVCGGHRPPTQSTIVDPGSIYEVDFS